VSTAPETAEDAERKWSAAVQAANVPTLIAVLVHLTGDLRWLEPKFAPSRAQGLSDNDSGDLPAEVQQEIRAATTAAIIAWANGRPPQLTDPDPALIVRILSFVLGEPIPDGYGEMIAFELRTGLGHTPATTHQTNTISAHRVANPTSTKSSITAIVIGAGMSGLCASIELANAGIDHVVIERHESVGGTWLENRYPGCGVDVPSHLYSYSFAPNEWSMYFGLRDEIHAYFERIANEFGVRPRIRFRTSVEKAVWDEATNEWLVETKDVDGIRATLRANVVISAVGAFNKPRIPSVPGLGDFAGPSVHTAQWPTDGVDLRGRRVAVIGNGASAMQVVPAIAEQVSELSVFQRSAHWTAPFEKFRVAIPETVQLLLTEVPLYRLWYRIRLSWAFNDRSYDALQKDPNWPHPERSLNPINDGHRRALTRYIENEVGDRTDLLPHVIPNYPPFGKRMLLDNGWYRTLRRSNVQLVHDPVASVGKDFVITTAGEKVSADVLIWATGFDVVHFLAPMEIRGIGGHALHDVWEGDDARAYLGTAVPGFPNFFCLYGPNTQFGHGGSLIFVVERQMHYVRSILEAMVAAGGTAAEVRADVHDAYNERIDRAHEAMVWTHQGMDTYYRNSKGRVVVNNPFRIIDVWRNTEAANADDFVFTTRP
jgi:4-hydroxyacetophenone monooxygenase